MKPPATTWIARPPGYVRAPALLLFLAFAGCHSIQFGPMIHDTNTAASAPARATLGVPTAASEANHFEAEAQARDDAGPRLRFGLRTGSEEHQSSDHDELVWPGNAQGAEHRIDLATAL